MSCQASRLKASKHTEKVSVLWNGRDSIRKKQTQQRNQLPRYTIELARTNTESKASFRKEVSPYDKLNRREPPLRTESEQQQIVRIVLNNNFTSSDRDQNNIQIDIINSRPASKAGRLESMLAVEAPETPTPVARYNIARNGITATEKPYQSKTLSESNYASSHVTRKKIFPLDTSKISLSAIGDHLPNSKAPEVLIQDISMTESQHKSTISRHSMKPIQPLGLSKASAQQSNQEPSKIASNEPSSFPML